MPPKVRELIAELEAAGFVNDGGKGSHRNYVQPHRPKPVTISGSSGEDAKPYQEKNVRDAIKDVQP
jgi:predicted RNA binding protein YcfA (HicA-like mRNA interferase family)